MKTTAPASRNAAPNATEIKLSEMAERLGMKLLKLGKKKVAFITYEQGAGVKLASEVHVYELSPSYLAGRSWTPGACLATLTRKNSNTAQLEALGALLVQD